MIDMTQSSTENPSPNQRLWLILFLVLVIAIPGGVFVGRWLQAPGSEFTSVAALTDCDLQQSGCVAEFARGGKVTIEIQPRPIPLLKPLTIEVDLKGIQATAVAVDFAGVDMDMGFNRFLLEGQGERWRTERAALPVCTRERMLWEAQVLIETEQGIQMAPFRFWTSR